MGERRPPVRIREEYEFITIVLSLDFEFILLGPNPDRGAIFLAQLEVVSNELQGSFNCFADLRLRGADRDDDIGFTQEVFRPFSVYNDDGPAWIAD